MRVPIGSNVDMRKERLVGSGKSATRGVSDVIMTILWISLPINRLLLLLCACMLIISIHTRTFVILTRYVNGFFIKKAERLYVPVQHDPNLTDDSNSPWFS